MHLRKGKHGDLFDSGIFPISPSPVSPQIECLLESCAYNIPRVLPTSKSSTPDNRLLSFLTQVQVVELITFFCAWHVIVMGSMQGPSFV